MHFTTPTFAVFLAVVLAVYWRLQRPAQNRFLAVASYVFYGWWNWRFTGLLLLSTLVDFHVGKALGREDRPRARPRLVATSVAVNLGVLGLFKYYDFFAESVIVGLAALGLRADVALVHVVLPVGISFYTFQTMAYTIDVWREQLDVRRDLLDYLVFVCFFPQLVAGPIVRYRDIAQSLQQRATTLLMASDGVLLFALGFAKKVLIADSVAPLVDAVYAADSPGLIPAWAAAFGYSIQIYFDFSGYSDMAIGLGLLLGFRFPENFRSPYRSHSITEMWRRWHIYSRTPMSVSSCVTVSSTRRRKRWR